MIALMPKFTIHPIWYFYAKIYLDGQLLFKVGATKSKLEMDIWFETHPTYTGREEEFDMEGQKKHFLQRYGWKRTFTKKATIDANNSTTN